MKPISTTDRILLLLAALLSAFQVAVGVDGSGTLPILCYTIAFGVLLVACLLLIILGFEILDSSLVVIVSTIIPLSLSLGLVWEYLGNISWYYLAFTLLGFLAVILTRRFTSGRVAVIVIAAVHGIAGLAIFLLPILLSMQGITNPGFIFVGIGGALIGIGGLLLSFLKTGRPILSLNTILSLLPGLLLLMTTAFVVGFVLR
ncbi:MAG: hypothetical protein ACK2UM_17465 [Anaerolineales bacterium]|jgi:hypothetical protein